MKSSVSLLLQEVFDSHQLQLSPLAGMAGWLRTSLPVLTGFPGSASSFAGWQFCLSFSTSWDFIPVLILVL